MLKFLRASPNLIGYAQIDLKNVTIKFVDGNSQSGFLVNNAGGYPAGTATVTVDGGTGIIRNHTRVCFASEAPSLLHVVTAHTETLGNTTSITFTPALGDAIVDNDPITVGGRELEVIIGEGNLTYNEQRTMEYKLDRGLLDTVREGDQIPIDITLDFRWDFLKATPTETTNDEPTIEDALKKRGGASNWVSSSSDPCEPYAVDIELCNTPDCEEVLDEIITLVDFRWESLDHDLRAGTVAATGKSNSVQASIVRDDCVNCH
jgi:hypothetical protein